MEWYQQSHIAGQILQQMWYQPCVIPQKHMFWLIYSHFISSVAEGCYLKTTLMICLEKLPSSIVFWNIIAISSIAK